MGDVHFLTQVGIAIVKGSMVMWCHLDVNFDAFGGCLIGFGGNLNVSGSGSTDALVVQSVVITFGRLVLHFTEGRERVGNRDIDRESAGFGWRSRRLVGDGCLKVGLWWKRFWMRKGARLATIA